MSCKSMQQIEFWNICKITFILVTVTALWSVPGCTSTDKKSTTSNGDGGTPAAPSTVVTGIAAAGAPITGFVEAKEADGTLITTSIDETDGSYSLDMVEMTPPVILHAAGFSGNFAYSLYSVAQEADLGGTVNITPLTDLVIACVVGSDTDQFFASPDFAVLTADNLDTGQDTLKTQLAALLTGFGIDANFDIFNSPFDAAGTGFDSLLDALDVVIDQDTENAVVTFRGDGTTATYDLTSCTNGAPLDAGAAAIDAYQTAQQAAEALRQEIIALYAGGTPTAADFAPVIHSAALRKGWGYDDYRTSTSSLPSWLWELIDFKLYEFTDDVTRKEGVIFFGDEKQLLWDDGDGWKLAGDQQNWGGFIDAYPELDQEMGTIKSTLTIHMFGAIGNIVSGDYITASGPGVALTLTQYGESDDSAGQSSGLESATELTPIQIAAMTNRAEYTMTRYSSDDTERETYLAYLYKKPPENPTVADFAEITSPTKAEMAAYTGGDITVTWTRPEYNTNRQVYLALSVSDGSREEVKDASWETLAPDATSVTFTPPTLAGGLTYVGISYMEVNVHDVYNRWYNTYISGL